MPTASGLIALACFLLAAAHPPPHAIQKWGTVLGRSGRALGEIRGVGRGLKARRRGVRVGVTDEWIRTREVQESRDGGGLYEIRAIPGISTGMRELKDIIRENPMVVVIYHATWCRACKYMVNKIEKYSKGPFNGVVFVSVDHRFARAVIRDMGVSEFPTIHFFRDQHKVNQMKGTSLHQLEDLIQANLALTNQPNLDFNHFE